MVVLSDWNLLSPKIMDGEYRANVLKVQRAAASYGLDLVPCLMPIGYSGSLLDVDPNLAEGVPVKNALFVVRGKEAALEPDPAISLAGGDFEKAEGDKFAGWEMQDNVGTSTFADHDVVHGGRTSVRMERIGEASPKYGHSRLMQSLNVQPFRQYHFRVWVKTQDFDTSAETRVAVLVPNQEDRCVGDLPVHVKRTQEWTCYDLLFNSLDHNKLNLYLGVWGGKTGRIWWDDAVLEEVGLLNPLRRAGTPLTVKGEDGTAYVEGKDFAPVRDEKLAAYPSYHQPLTLHLTPQSRIPRGPGSASSYYHPLLMTNDGLVVCMSEPKTYELLRRQAARVNDLLHPKIFFMQHDEIRIGNWDAACQARHLTPGQILAENVKQCVRILRDVNPKADIWVWSDMFSPSENAVDNYYSVNGTWAGSWEGLGPEVGIANWNIGGAETLNWFGTRGNRQILCGYYDGDSDGATIKKWLDQAKGTPRVVGAMYTTWQDKYEAMEAWAKAAWGG